MNYIWQLKHWPHLTWKSNSLLELLGQARLAQGNLLGRVRRLGFDLGEEAQAEILTEEAIKTSAIEGERLSDRQIVRGLVAALNEKCGYCAGSLNNSGDEKDKKVTKLFEDAQVDRTKRVIKPENVEVVLSHAMDIAAERIQEAGDIVKKDLLLHRSFRGVSLCWHYKNDR